MLWVFKTESGESDLNPAQLGGPIVGFRVLTRTVTYPNTLDVYSKAPIYMSAMYSKCACSGSQFKGKSAPYNMEARAV